MPAYSQNITLNTQEEVDNFPINYPDLTVVPGHLIIDGEDISNLDSLYSINSVQGLLIIKFCYQLLSLQGFESLERIDEGLIIQYNHNLYQIDAFPSLERIGSDFTIRHNEKLDEVSGLNNLTYIGDTLLIDDNESLDSITGMMAIDTIGGSLKVQYNPELMEINGWNNVEYVGGKVKVWYNDVLTSFPDLKVDTIYSGISFRENPALTDVSGFNEMVVLEGGLYFHYNDMLTDISGFNSLQTIGKSLIVAMCDVITRLSGFTSLVSVTEDIFIGSEGDLVSIDGFSSLQNVYGGFALRYNKLDNLNALNSLSFVGDDFSITGSDSLVNLEGLNNLTSIGGSLYLENNESLINLQGLNQLCKIGGGMSVQNNDALEGFDGLQQLDSVGCISLKYNGNIENLEGLGSLKYIKESVHIEYDGIRSLSGTHELNYLGSDIIIENAPNLEDVNAFGLVEHLYGKLKLYETGVKNMHGFESLKTIDDELYITHNDSLKNMEGLNNLETVNNRVCIYYNDCLETLTGLNNLTSVVNLDIHDNEGLYSLEGLNSLAHVEEVMDIYGNLSDISALNALKTVGMWLRIVGVDNLTDLTVLNNLDYTIPSALIVLGCPDLSVCNTEMICNFLAYGGELFVDGNNTGCNSVEEVNEACFPEVEGSPEKDFITLYPNPVKDELLIAWSGNQELNSISMYNGVGQKVLSQGSSYSVDVSALQPGIYIVELEFDSERIRKRVLVE